MNQPRLSALLSSFALVLVSLSCTGSDGNDEAIVPADDGGTDIATDADHGDVDGESADRFTFQIGSGVPLIPWRDGGDLPVVAGFQGGHHTEHEALLSGIERDALNASIISVVVRKDGTQLASGGWLFDVPQYDAVPEGWQTSVPPVVFRSSPPIGEEVELVAGVRLADGRELDVLLRMTLVDQ